MQQFERKNIGTEHRASRPSIKKTLQLLAGIFARGWGSIELQTHNYNT
jgi:hypothetical protein